MIVHGSGPNKAIKEELVFVIQSYIGTNVDQVIGKVYVQQTREKIHLSFTSIQKDQLN